MVETDADKNLNYKNNNIEDEFDNCEDDNVYVYETLISEGCIKREPCDKKDEPENIHNSVDIKEEIIEDPTVLVQETVLRTNIKEDCLIDCKGCGEEYDLYCLKCPMLIHILDSNRPHWQDNRVRRTLPKHFVDICKTTSGVGITALRLIPEGVVFGPFEGLDSIKDDAGSKWKLKNKELVYTKDPKRLNWMQYIRSGDESSHQNLMPFQHEGRLYYRSNHNISAGEELLVCWGESGVQGMKDDCWTPPICERLNDTYACTLCCVGYKSMHHLAAHNSRCPAKQNLNDFCKGIIQCAFCKIYVDEKEYSNYHLDRCCERNTKKYVTAPSSEDTDKSELKDDKYKCSMCEYSTSLKCRLEQHQLTHSDIRMYKCSECPYQAHTTSKLQRHMRKHANRSRSHFECQQCSERFTRADLFAMHQRKKHSASVYKCDKCVFESINAGNLRRHLTTHKDAKPYRCNACDKQFKQETSLHRHVKNVHNEKKEKYKCPKCDYESIYRANMKKHLSAVHSGIKRFQCSKCAFKTCYKGIVERHLRYHEDAEPIKRENCDKDFQSQQSPGCHEKESLTIPPKSYSCCKCTYQTNRKYNFDQHLKVHDADRVKPYGCTLCPFKTITKWKLEQHITFTHNDDKPFKCNVCPKMFKRKQDLTKHARNIHSESGENEYKCSQCSFETKYKTSIEQHVNAHNKRELFQCSKCNFNTHHKSSFGTHQKRHEPTKKHCCKFCSFRANDEGELNEHLKTHELIKSIECDEHSKTIEDVDEIRAENKMLSGQQGQKVYDCPTCGMTFIFKRYLVKHIKRLHARKVNKEKSLIESDDY